MGAITSIMRDWGENPAIVRITTTDNLATILAPGYITSQATAINNLQNGTFEWLKTDIVMIAYLNEANDTQYTVNLFDYSIKLDLFSLNNVMLTAQFTLTQTQIETMYTTPVGITAIATPPAGYVIEVFRWALDLVFNTTGYAGGGAIQLQYGNTVHGGGVAACGTIAAASINGFSAASGQVSASAGMSAGANAAQELFISNATGVFTTGDGTINGTIWYTIREV